MRSCRVVRAFGLAIELDTELDFPAQLLADNEDYPDVKVVLEKRGGPLRAPKSFRHIGSDVHSLSSWDRAYEDAARRQVYLERSGEMGAAISSDLIKIDCTHTVSLGTISESLCFEPCTSLLHLRGVASLHGATVCAQNKVVGFLAESGTGKSTLIAYLISKGFQFLSDDVIVLRNGRTWGAYPSVKLEPDAAVRFNTDIEPLPQSVQTPKRNYRPISENAFVSGEYPIEMLFELVPINSPGVFYDTKLGKREAFHTLLRHTMAGFAIPSWCWESVQKEYVELARRVPIYRVVYHKSWETLNKLENLLKAKLDSLRMQ